MISTEFNLGLLPSAVLTDENIMLAKTAFNAFKAENTKPIPYDARFSKETLVKMSEHKWMLDVNMTLVTKDKYNSLSDLYDELVGKAYVVDKSVIPVLKDKELSAIAIDLETTGLSKGFRRVGGAVVSDVNIVGVCLAASPFEGYYIPVMHTETDGIANYAVTEIADLLSRIESDCFTIYHNAQYDREISQVSSGVRLGKTYADTMLIAYHQGLSKSEDGGSGYALGLKPLSVDFLQRRMVEITELMRDSDFVNFNRLPATMAYVYGCSDAVNTYGLFCQLLNWNTKGLCKSPVKTENPFIIQKLATDLDYKACDVTRSMMRFGMPIDIEVLEVRLKTMIRRELILERNIYSILKDRSIKLSSSAQVGEWIGNTLWEQFKTAYSSKASEADLLIKFVDIIAKRFSIERKENTLKSGEVKVRYNANKNVFGAMLDNVRGCKWIESNVQEQLFELATYLQAYNSVEHEIKLLVAVYRSVFNDDYGIPRGRVDLRFNGAGATGRWANAGDGRSNAEKKRERVTFDEKGRATFIPGSTQLVGINAQGIPSVPFKEVKAKRLTSLPPSFIAEKEALDQDVDSAFIDLIKTL